MCWFWLLITPVISIMGVFFFKQLKQFIMDENIKATYFYLLKLVNEDLKPIRAEKKRERAKRYREKNKDKIREQKKRYKLKHKDKINAQKKKYREKNKVVKQVYQKNYREHNKEKFNAYNRKWRAKLKEEKQNKKAEIDSFTL